MFILLYHDDSIRLGQAARRHQIQNLPEADVFAPWSPQFPLVSWQNGMPCALCQVLKRKPFHRKLRKLAVKKYQCNRLYETEFNCSACLLALHLLGATSSSLAPGGFPALEQCLWQCKLHQPWPAGCPAGSACSQSTPSSCGQPLKQGLEHGLCTRFVEGQKHKHGNSICKRPCRWWHHTVPGRWGKCPKLW